MHMYVWQDLKSAKKKNKQSLGDATYATLDLYFICGQKLEQYSHWYCFLFSDNTVCVMNAQEPTSM